VKTPNQNGKTQWGGPRRVPTPCIRKSHGNPREFPEITLEERWEIWGQWIEQEQTKLRESTKDLEGFVMDNLPSTQKIMEGVQKRVDKALKDFEQFCLEVLQEALPPTH
jgi:hypothetical protein